MRAPSEDSSAAHWGSCRTSGFQPCPPCIMKSWTCAPAQSQSLGAKTCLSYSASQQVLASQGQSISKAMLVASLC